MSREASEITAEIAEKQGEMEDLVDELRDSLGIEEEPETGPDGSGGWEPETETETGAEE